LWEFTPEHGCGLKKGLDVLLPYFADQSKWPHKQIRVFALSPSFRLTLCMFSSHFEDDVYLDTANKIKKTKYPERNFTALISGQAKSSASKGSDSKGSGAKGSASKGSETKGSATQGSETKEPALAK